jgi:hypothetical protein
LDRHFPSIKVRHAKDFTLEGHLEHMKCSFLVMHGGHDVLTVSQARKVYDYGRAKGVDVTLRLLSEEETGAEHCQHDNPTIGQGDPGRLAGGPLRHPAAGAPGFGPQPPLLRPAYSGLMPASLTILR